MIEQGLLQLIGADAGVKALVPADISGTTQVYWLLAPKGAKAPYIILSRVDTKDSYDMQGATGLRRGLFQVACVTNSDAGVSTGFNYSRLMSKAVRLLMESYRGTLPDSDATRVSAVITDKDFDMPYQEGQKGFVFTAVLHFYVSFY